MTTAEMNEPLPAPQSVPAAIRPGEDASVRAGRSAAVPPSGPAVRRLTGSQLRSYRRELEHALKTLPALAPVRALLAEHLAAVRGEQETRAAAEHPRRPGPVNPLRAAAAAASAATIMMHPPAGSAR